MHVVRIRIHFGSRVIFPPIIAGKNNVSMTRTREASGSAEQPASVGSSSTSAKLLKRVDSETTVVAYIACPPEAQNFYWGSDLPKFMTTVTNAIEAGANIINIAFSRSIAREFVDTHTPF